MKSISRQRLYQLRHQKLGLCVLCPEKAVDRNHCEKHRLSNLVEMRERARRKNGAKTRYLSSPSYVMERELEAGRKAKRHMRKGEMV